MKRTEREQLLHQVVGSAKLLGFDYIAVVGDEPKTGKEAVTALVLAQSEDQLMKLLGTYEGHYEIWRHKDTQVH